MKNDHGLSDVEAARADDLPAVTRLLERLKLPLADLSAQFPEAFVVVRSGESVVGVAGLELHGGAALLRSVGVDPDYQSLGIGKRLVEDRLAEATRAGVGQVHVLTNTAYEFFTSLGFEAMRRTDAPPALASTPEFVSVCPASAVCLIKAC